MTADREVLREAVEAALKDEQRHGHYVISDSLADVIGDAVLALHDQGRSIQWGLRRIGSAAWVQWVGERAELEAYAAQLPPGRFELVARHPATPWERVD